MPGWPVLLVGLAIGALLTVRLLASSDWDITTFMAFGEDDIGITGYAEEILGRVVKVRPALGHDGRFFFLQALDPLYLEPAQHSVYLDRPIYRSQRMLYPMLAGLGGLLPPVAVPWGLVVVNVLALGIGGLGTARLAQQYGANRWWGLAFPLNLGILAEFAISGAGIVAFAAGIWGILALEREQLGSSAAWFTVSVLAREAMLVFVAGAALYRWRRTRTIPIWLAGTPLLTALGWALYVRMRLGTGSGVQEVQEIGIPFMGIVGAIPLWRQDRFNLLVGVLIIGLLAVFGVRVLRSKSYLAWASGGFILLAVLLTRQVWSASFNISRAVAPVLTAFVIVTFAASNPGQNGTDRLPDPDVRENNAG